MSRSKDAARPVTRILDLLENVKPSGNGWTALCPAHDDNLNSLSLAEGDDGRALLHCFAGCDIADIVAEIDLELRDLFPGTVAKIRRRGAHRDGAHD